MAKRTPGDAAAGIAGVVVDTVPGADDRRGRGARQFASEEPPPPLGPLVARRSRRLPARGTRRRRPPSRPGLPGRVARSGPARQCELIDGSRTTGGTDNARRVGVVFGEIGRPPRERQRCHASTTVLLAELSRAGGRGCPGRGGNRPGFAFRAGGRVGRTAPRSARRCPPGAGLSQPGRWRPGRRPAVRGPRGSSGRRSGGGGGWPRRRRPGRGAACPCRSSRTS